MHPAEGPEAPRGACKLRPLICCLQPGLLAHRRAASGEGAHCRNAFPHVMRTLLCSSPAAWDAGALAWEAQGKGQGSRARVGGGRVPTQSSGEQRQAVCDPTVPAMLRVSHQPHTATCKLTRPAQLPLRRVPEGIPARPAVQLAEGQQRGPRVASMLLQCGAGPPAWQQARHGGGRGSCRRDMGSRC